MKLLHAQTLKDAIATAGAHQAEGRRVRGEEAARMGIEQGGTKRCVQGLRQISGQTDHMTMPHMDAIEIAQGNDRTAIILRQSAMTSQDLHG